MRKFTMEELIAAKMQMLGNNQFVYGMQHPGKTKVGVLENAINELQRLLEDAKENPDESEFGFQISIELIRKTESDEDRLKNL